MEKLANRVYLIIKTPIGKYQQLITERRQPGCSGGHEDMALLHDGRHRGQASESVPDRLSGHKVDARRIVPFECLQNGDAIGGVFNQH